MTKKDKETALNFTKKTWLCRIGDEKYNDKLETIQSRPDSETSANSTTF